VNLSLKKEYVFFVGPGAGVVVATIIIAPPFWYANLILLMMFYGVLYATRTRPDRGFFTVCAAAPLVVACSAMNIWAGLLVVWMLALMGSWAPGIFDAGADRTTTFLLFLCTTLLIAAGIDSANHVVLPLICLCSAVVVFAGAMTIRDYQFRKQYSGAPP
jgi:hypothetical protein